MLPGVQVLLAFLLSVPFAQRFTRLDRFGVRMFGVSLVAAMASTVCLLTPIVLHRMADRTARGPVINRRTAEQMACGAQRLLHADLAVAATGVGARIRRRASRPAPCSLRWPSGATCVRRGCTSTARPSA